MDAGAEGKRALGGTLSATKRWRTVGALSEGNLSKEERGAHVPSRHPHAGGCSHSLHCLQ